MKKILIIILIIAIISIGICVSAGAGNFSFIIRNASGTDVADFADDGVVTFLSRCAAMGSTCDVDSGDCVSVTNCFTTPTNSFLLKNTSVGITAWISNNGIICTNGSITQEHSMSGVCATPSFNISDSSLVTQACFDNSGSLYTRDVIDCGTACGINCGAGVCSGKGVCEPGEECDADGDCITNNCFEGVGKCDCGDNIAQGTEVCDGTDLRGFDCTDCPGCPAYTGGTLGCNTNCLSFDEGGCL